MRKTILAALILAVPTVAAADEKADAVKARQEHMKGYGESVGTIAKMAKGEMDYDADTAQAAADKIVELANTDVSIYFLPGTSSEDMPGVSYALPALWTDGAKAGEIAGQLPDAALALQMAAGEGKGEMAGALGGVGKVCQECHKSFKAEKD